MKVFFQDCLRDFLTFPKEQVKKAVSGYDFIIGCGLAPAYFNKIGNKLDLFIPYGSDLDYQPYLFKKTVQQKTLKNCICDISSENGYQKCKICYDI